MKRMIKFVSSIIANSENKAEVSGVDPPDKPQVLKTISVKGNGYRTKRGRVSIMPDRFTYHSLKTIIKYDIYLKRYYRNINLVFNKKKL